MSFPVIGLNLHMNSTERLCEILWTSFIDGPYVNSVTLLLFRVRFVDLKLIPPDMQGPADDYRIRSSSYDSSHRICIL